MKLQLLSEEQAKLGAQWNATKPTGVPPLPAAFANAAIEDVDWSAPGRDEDPSVGIQIKGVRKTSSGYVYNDWWYFKKLVHAKGEQIKKKGRVEGVVSEDRFYWYRKKRLPAQPGQEEGRILEEYVGLDLKDPDTGIKIYVPETLRRPEDFQAERKAEPAAA